MTYEERRELDREEEKQHKRHLLWFTRGAIAGSGALLVLLKTGILPPPEVIAMGTAMMIAVFGVGAVTVFAGLVWDIFGAPRLLEWRFRRAYRSKK